MISYPIEVGGVRTRVLQSGTSGTPVLFIHGTGGRAERWVRNLDAIAAAGFRCYALDLPGHGFAAKGPGVECSVPAYRRMLGSFIESLAAPELVIVGTSLGGHVAASLACEAEVPVRALVLCGSMGLVPIGEAARKRIQGGTAKQSREDVANRLSRVIFDASLITPEMIEEEVQVNNSPGARQSFETLGRYIAASLDDDAVGARLAKANFPVLLVWGDRDQTVPLELGKAARELLPKSRMVVLAGAAHSPYLEKAEAFNRIVLDFLAGKLGDYKADGVEYR